jgi:DNA-directed RNA polymerase delta subunit
MEEIEIISWLTLDAIKKEAETIETVGDLQSGHCMAIFCRIEEDYLELCYSDTASNFLRRYEDREEFDLALVTRKEEFGEAAFEEENGLEDDFESDEDEDEFSEDSDNF